MWHDFSWKFHVISCQKIDGSLIKMNTKFHDFCTPFILIFVYFPCSNTTWILDKVKSWNFLGIWWKRFWDFHRIRSHFRQNFRQKDMRKPVPYFNRVVDSTIKSFVSFSFEWYLMFVAHGIISLWIRVAINRAGADKKPHIRLCIKNMQRMYRLKAEFKRNVMRGRAGILSCRNK